MVAPQEKKRKEEPKVVEESEIVRGLKGMWGLVQASVKSKGRGTEGKTLDSELKEYVDLALARRTPVRPTNFIPVVVDPETQRKIEINQKALGWVLAMTEVFDRAAEDSNPKKNIKLKDDAMVG